MRAYGRGMDVGGETRAEIARRRMAELMASFDAQGAPTAHPGRPALPRSHAAVYPVALSLMLAALGVVLAIYLAV